MDTPQLLADNPSLYINRELSWIRFNHHVLDEALDNSHPLLERVKFLAIYANNLDEFFMIRVSGLQRQPAKGYEGPAGWHDPCPAGWMRSGRCWTRDQGAGRLLAQGTPPETGRKPGFISTSTDTLTSTPERSNAPVLHR